MDFAPYQDVDPERERALSPPPSDGRRSKSPQAPTATTRPPAARPDLPRTSEIGNEYVPAGYSIGAQERGVHFDAFQTSLPLRLDYEAMLAYLLLPPAGPVLLLMMEHKSDYVRFVGLLRPDMRTDCAHMFCSFHAWQSSMLFTCMFVGSVAPTDNSCHCLTSSQVVHLIFTWSPVLSWLLFAGDVALIGFLALHAYRDGTSQRRKECALSLI